MIPDRFDKTVDVLAELPGQATLADPGRSDDRDQPGPVFPGRGMEEVLEQAKLLVAPHERRFERLRTVPAPALGDHPDGPPGGNRSYLALQDLRSDRLEGDRPACGALCRLPDEDRPGPCHGLEPAGRVDKIPRDHALVGRPQGDCRLAGEDAGARRDTWPEALDHVDQLERRPDGSLGVVLVGDRGAPDRHHSVPDELLDRPAVPSDHVGRDLEVAGEQVARLFGVAAVRERREPDEVGEENGDEAALGHADRRGRCCRFTHRHREARDRGGPGCEWRRTFAAELRERGVGRATGRTPRREPRGALHAELRPRLVLRRAVRADHHRRRCRTSAVEPNPRSTGPKRL